MHIVSLKLCCDISGVLHEVLTYFLYTNKTFAYLALYGWEPYRKANLSSILDNDSHCITSVTLAVTSTMLKFKYHCKIVTVSSQAAQALVVRSFFFFFFEMFTRTFSS